MFTSRPLDRERRPAYEMRVKVTNDPNYYHDGKKKLEEQDASVAFVKIRVEDENDSPPKFLEKILYAGELVFSKDATLR